MQNHPTGQNRPRELKVTLSRWNGDLCMNISGLSLPYLCLDRTETSPFTHPCRGFQKQWGITVGDVSPHLFYEKLHTNLILTKMTSALVLSHRHIQVKVGKKTHFPHTGGRKHSQTHRLGGRVCGTGILNTICPGTQRVGTITTRRKCCLLQY